jgi:PRTRC genetic system protein D
MNADRVGLDVGFGVVKSAIVRDGKLKTDDFPSLIGQRQELAKYRVLGGGRRRATRLVYEGIDYYVGDDALEYSRTKAGRQDRGRIGTVEERVMMLAALARLGVDEAHIVTGLPIMWFDSRRDLVRSWKGEHRFIWGRKERVVTVHGVITVPQPFGGFYAHFLGDNGIAQIEEAEMLRTYGFLDVGWNTTDLSAVRELKPVERWSNGERVGVRDVLEIVGEDVQSRCGLELLPHELDRAVKDGRVEAYGKYYDIGGVTKSAVTSVSQQVVAAATRLWGNGERFTRILIFGGGAGMMGQALRDAFPHNGVVLPKPGLANAVGFCRFAQRPALFG